LHPQASKVRQSVNLTLLIPVAVETFGSWSKEGLSFVRELGKRRSVSTGDPRETSFLFQRLSAAIQMGNAASIAGTLPGGIDEEEE